MKNDTTERDLLNALRMVLPLAEAYMKIAAPGPETLVDNAKLETARAAIAAAEQKAAQVILQVRRREDPTGLRSMALLIAAAVIYAQSALKPEETDIIAAQTLAVDEAESLLAILEERGQEQ